MGTSFLRLAVYLCLGSIACAQELSMYPPEENQWYQVDTDVTLVCKWQHDSGDRVVVDWKESGGSGLRKVTEGDEDNSYVYKSSVLGEERQQEFHDFADDAADDVIKIQFSELTIINITLTDPKIYFCYIELGNGIRDDNSKFTLNLYQLPTVTAVGNVMSVDIRPPIETPTTAVPASEEESINGTETEPDYVPDYVSDEAAEATEQIEIECQIEGAFPKPTVVFTVGEGGETIEVDEVVWSSGSDNEPYSGVAVLKLDAKPEYDGKAVSCSVLIPTQPPTSVKSDTTSSLIEILHDVTEVRTTIIGDVSISGDEVQIRCDSDGNPKPSFSIQSDVSEKPDFEMSSDGRTFTIPSVIKGDAGTYWCVATLAPRSGDDSESRTMDSVNTETLKVHYIEDPTLSEDQDIVLKLGDDLREVTCSGNANPQSIPIWKKDGREMSSNSKLQINKAEYEDEGTYTCETKNEAGTRSKNIKIKVEGACVASFKTTTVTETSTEKMYNVRLECEATGQPACTVNIIPQSGSGLIGESKEDGKVLEISSLPLLSAPVMFFCTAQNTVGKSNVSATIGEDSEACCAEPQTAGLSIAAIIGIIMLVLVVIIGIPVACYFVKKRNAQPKEKTDGDAEGGEPEKEGLNKEASSEDSDTGSLPPPPAETDNDHRLNHGAHEMTTFSTNQ